jgi:hypothetical protein
MINVKSCNDCPFKRNDDCGGDYCEISTSQDCFEMPSYNEEYIPSECPIYKQKEIVVKLELGATIGKENFIKLQQLKGIFKEDVNQLRELYKKIQ